MERKTKQRILGAFAIAAFIVILLPLFQSGNESQIETKLVKAPPFPDQSVQVAAPASASPDNPIIPVQAPQAAENDIAEPSDIMAAARPTVVNDLGTTSDTSSVKPEAVNQAKVAEVEPAIAPEGDDFKTTVSNETIKTTDTSTAVKTAEVAIPKTIQTAMAKKTKAEKTEKFVPVIKMVKQEKKRVPLAQTPLNDNGLIELKNPVWVIQIGSFKNKANALRLVNQLRANGYRAFIQQVSNTFGENTRVFVGPESKHNSARALATQLESDMHIRGIVISYKPLAL